MGVVANITLKNTPRIDVLATNLVNGKFVNIQVKTMSVGNNQGWRLSQKDEEKSNIKNHFYVLVNLRGAGQSPEYYVIPQSKLAERLYEVHRRWLAGNKKRKDNIMRIFDPYRSEEMREFGEKYKNNWEILRLS